MEQEAETANAECQGKTSPFSAYQIYKPRGVLFGAHTPRALTAGETLTHWQAGPTTTMTAA
jgi:hypothetical protein